MKELLPCPFCGKVPHTHLTEYPDSGHSFSLRCLTMGCFIHGVRFEFANLEAWNRRAEPEPVPDGANLEVSALRMALSEMDEEMGAHLDRIRALEARMADVVIVEVDNA